jgi:hypothetical protein
MPEPADIEARVRRITKDLRRVARELRSFAGDTSARTFVDHQALGPFVARLGRQVAWVADELRAATDGPPCKEAPLVCYRVVVEHGVAYVWSRTALGPVEQWLIETANREARLLADQVERENLSAWLWELSQGQNPAPPPRHADRLATFRRASELVLTGTVTRARRPAARRASHPS